MSGKSSAVMFVFLVAIALAAKNAEDLGGGGLMGGREIASKKGRLSGDGSGGGADAVVHTEKIRGPAGVAIELVGDGPARAGDTFVLKGVVSSRRALEGLAFQWVLPKGVELLNGEASGRISAVAPGQDYVVQVTLRALRDTNEQIHLTVKGPRFGDTAQFNTLDESMLRETRKARAAASAASTAEAQKAARAKKRRSQDPATYEPDYKVFQ